MRQGIFRLPLVILLVACGLLFAGGEARANFNSFCYKIDNTVNIINDSSGEFSYHFSPLPNCTSNTSVKNVLFEIPADVPLGNLVTTYRTTGAFLTLPCTALAAGVGDSDTRLGVGDPRYRVLICNSPTSGGFPKDYWIKLSLTNASTTDKKLGSSIQVVQLKAGNSLSDSDVAFLPALVDVPKVPPSFGTAPVVEPNRLYAGSSCTNVTLSWSDLSNVNSVTVSYGSTKTTVCSSNCGTGNVLLPCPTATTTYVIEANGPGGSTTATATVTVLSPPPTATLSPTYLMIPFDSCLDLSYSSSNADLVVIQPTVGVVDNNTSSSARVCPTDNTTYTLTASGPGGTATAVSQIDVGTPPPPTISLARKTLEKIGLDGTKSYVTTYEKNDVPACSCVTGPGELIPEYPCEDDTLPTYCKPVTTTDQQPLLVCLTFLLSDKLTLDMLRAKCPVGSNGCAVLTNVQCTNALGVPAECAAYCDQLVAVTNEMSMQTGSGTCCTTTSKKCQIVSGRQICTTVYTTGPCEVGGTCP